MYRVAVVQNESESLRYSYADIVQTLEKLARFDRYSFEQFDNRTILELFDPGQRNLANYDSLFVSTNATSDHGIHAALVENRDAVADFLAGGGGVFVSYQKKLSVPLSAVLNIPSAAGLLPDHYDFQFVERPEADSGEGVLSFVADSAGSHRLPSRTLLNYPEEVTLAATTQHCTENDFKRHFYRSYIVAQSQASYSDVVVDVSYGDASPRRLLLANRAARAGERVVLSTIAIDWERHSRLLTNVVAYITEGRPEVAFIDYSDAPHDDFDYVVSSARLSKVAHDVYSSPDQIPQPLRQAYSVFVFSARWPEDTVSEFWRELASDDLRASPQGRRYRRVYRLSDIGGVAALTQISNYSSVDIVIDSVLLWLAARYRGRMWDGGFWNSHDVLLMMCGLGVSVDSYLGGVFADIDNHYKAGSYDGVMGATCGLLDLVNELHKAAPEALALAGYGPRRQLEIARWIEQNFEAQSSASRQTAALSLLSFYETSPRAPEGVPDASESVRVWKRALRLSLDLEDERWSGLGEMDLCRLAAACLKCGNQEQVVGRLVERLAALKGPDGSWRTTARTAHVLVALLSNLDDFGEAAGARVDLHDLVYNAVIALRSRYREDQGSWDGDIQATATATLAIELHNRTFRYSTQEFFESIRFDTDRIRGSAVVQDRLEEMAELRSEADRQRTRLAELAAEVATRDRRLIETDESTTRANRSVTRNRVVATTSSVLLVGIVLTLISKYPQTARALFLEVGPVLPLLLGALIAVPITVLMTARQSNRNDK